ncbi:MAG: hypothetical protein EP338_02500 [Bacteroidetes bacterium]|nr:MAG: hypothetical protein EP338_02500 [Bacteroidota bacterium]
MPTDLLILLLSLPILYFTIRGVVKRYKDHGTYKKQKLYYADLLGMLIGIALLVISLLRLLGFDVPW